MSVGVDRRHCMPVRLNYQTQTVSSTAAGMTKYSHIVSFVLFFICLSRTLFITKYNLF